MQQTRTTALPYPIRITIAGISLPKPLVMDVALALGMAVLWWLVALLLEPTDAVNVLTDQRTIFMPAGLAFSSPYAVEGYFNPPWVALLFAPFARLPFYLAALLQLALYFVLLTLLIHKYGGRRKAVLITLTSFVALDSALELNVEWMICLGLLIPMRYSLPLLIIKPQTALGYYVTGKWRELLLAGVIGGAFFVVTLVLWPDWVAQMLEQVRVNNLETRLYNLAPMALSHPLLTIPIGLFLTWKAYQRKDAPLAILAWIFFVPYLALYGILLHLAMLSVRSARAGLVASLVIWVLFGLPLINHVFQALMR
jgi:hypothetical protein